MNYLTRYLLLLTAIAVVSCTPSKTPAPAPDGGGGAPVKEGELVPPLDSLPVGLDVFGAKIPADNELKGPTGAAKVELGRYLFFEKRLSSDNTVSCATCHDPAKGWSNGAAVATGVGGQKGGRSSPSIINRLFSEIQFWDGRAASLEEQALSPIANPIEMNLKIDDAVARLSNIGGYKPLFAAAYGDDKVSPGRIAKAIASFERTVVSGNSPFDRYEAGDKTAMSESAVRGKAIFLDNNKGRCSICHAGFNFTDEKFHNIGVGGDKPDTFVQDHAGRQVITKSPADLGAYKTPTLRNIADTAPYMHDGSEATLEETVEFYSKGDNPGTPNLDKEIKKLDLTDQDKKDLVEFMKALSGDVTKVTAPAALQ